MDKFISQTVYPSVEQVANICFAKFESLPKTGKPTNNEWTVLAGVVQYDEKEDACKVVSLGCGTKCIGKSKLCKRGLILNDSHAEIMARRSLMRYFYKEIKKSLNVMKEKQSIFTWCEKKGKFYLKSGLTYHFLSTQTPCGDACIKTHPNKLNEYYEPKAKKLKTRNECDNIVYDEDCIGNLVYTGAKLLGSQHKDLLEQSVGAMRTKPGKGERTLSMSCSDKLAKWQIMGVQGALIDVLLTEPIYFETMNFYDTNISLECLERAIWQRFIKDSDFNHSIYRLHKPQIRRGNASEFIYKQLPNKQPSPNGLTWSDIELKDKPYEVSVNGKRQGITSKKLYSPEASLQISKFHLFSEFLDILKLKPILLETFGLTTENIGRLNYLTAKSLSKTYQSAWLDAKTKYFKQWSNKPDDLMKFYVNKIIDHE
uniref:tRNA-specific adenosine deaminase 1 n=1 Tax=Glossina brevipalpis TaxID=37001 RepID=A0A1A9WCD8_9MUSC